MIPLHPFYMIRHGESEANKKGLYAGQSDVSLTKHGREQAQKAACTIRDLNLKIERIIHSHLDRARETAAILNEKLKLPISENPDLAEQNAGDIENTPYENALKYMMGQQNPPGGETHTEFQNRVKGAFIASLKQNKVPLIVCHGGIFRAFNLMHQCSPQRIKNCKLYAYKPQADKKPMPWSIKSYSE